MTRKIAVGYIESVARGIDDLDEPQVRQAAKLLERENERLVRQVFELKQKLNAMEGHSLSQMELLADLEHQLALRNKMVFGDSSEKRPAPKPPKEEKTPQPGHGPREQPELAHVERVHELDEADKVCTSCGGVLSEMAGQVEVSEEVDVLERQFVVVQHKRKKYRCACGGCIETALGPDKLIPGGRYSIDFAVSVAIAKYADHLPLERQVRMMKRHGLVIDSQTLWDQLNALAKWLAPAHKALHRHVLAQPLIGADETFWRLMENGGDNKRWQTWSSLPTPTRMARQNSSALRRVRDRVTSRFLLLLMNGRTTRNSKEQHRSCLTRTRSFSPPGCFVQAWTQRSDMVYRTASR